jgi:hypothetical protein
MNWVLAAVAAFATLPAVAQTVVEKQVTTTRTTVDCAAILNDAERLSCWQARAYVAPPPVASQTTERTVSTADGTVRTVETATTSTPAVVPAPVTRTITTTEPAPAVVSRTTTTTMTKN